MRGAQEPRPSATPNSPFHTTLQGAGHVSQHSLSPTPASFAFTALNHRELVTVCLSNSLESKLRGGEEFCLCFSLLSPQSSDRSIALNGPSSIQPLGTEPGGQLASSSSHVPTSNQCQCRPLLTHGRRVPFASLHVQGPSGLGQPQFPTVRLSVLVHIHCGQCDLNTQTG